MESNVIYIAHRGNMTGSCPEENSPEHILKALQAGFEVEVDVWYFNGDWFLGHSGTDYPISEGFPKNGLSVYCYRSGGFLFCSC